MKAAKSKKVTRDAPQIEKAEALRAPRLVRRAKSRGGVLIKNGGRQWKTHRRRIKSASKRAQKRIKSPQKCTQDRKSSKTGSFQTSVCSYRRQHKRCGGKKQLQKKRQQEKQPQGKPRRGRAPQNLLVFLRLVLIFSYFFGILLLIENIVCRITIFYHYTGGRHEQIIRTWQRAWRPL